MPQALPLPQPQPTSPYLFHEIYFEERGDDFVEKSRRHRGEDVLRDRELCLTFARSDDELVVGYETPPEDHSARPRRRALVLALGQRGRIIINARRGLEETVYTQDTFNVALLDRAATAELFAARQPDRVCDLRADLF